MNAPQFISMAIDRVHGQGSESTRMAMLESAQHLNLQKTGGMPSRVRLRLGGHYMVSAILIDVPDGLFNGATGVLKDVIESKLTTGAKALVGFLLNSLKKRLGELRDSQFMVLAKLGRLLTHNYEY